MTNVPYTQQTTQNEQGVFYPQQHQQRTDTGMSYAPQTKESITVATALVNPQTVPVHQHPQAGYVVRPGPMLPVAQHFTAPTGPTQEWQHGMCDCFDDWKICCIGFWAPCVLYSRTHRRLRTSPSTLRNFSCCNTVCWCNMCCGVGRFRQRDEIRYRYNLKGSVFGDYCRELCCASCSLCQEEMEVRDRERQIAQMHSAGYVAPQQMTYNHAPQ